MELSRDLRPGLPVPRDKAEENFIRHHLVLEECLADVIAYVRDRQ